jgi:hypothetical protein
VATTTPGVPCRILSLLPGLPKPIAGNPRPFMFIYIATSARDSLPAKNSSVWMAAQAAMMAVSSSMHKTNHRPDLLQTDRDVTVKTR